MSSSCPSADHASQGGNERALFDIESTEDLAASTAGSEVSYTLHSVRPGGMRATLVPTESDCDSNSDSCYSQTVEVEIVGDSGSGSDYERVPAPNEWFCNKSSRVLDPTDASIGGETQYDDETAEGRPSRFEDDRFSIASTGTRDTDPVVSSLVAEPTEDMPQSETAQSNTSSEATTGTLASDYAYTRPTYLRRYDAILDTVPESSTSLKRDSESLPSFEVSRSDWFSRRNDARATTSPPDSSASAAEGSYRQYSCDGQTTDSDCCDEPETAHEGNMTPAQTGPYWTTARDYVSGASLGRDSRVDQSAVATPRCSSVSGMRRVAVDEQESSAPASLLTVWSNETGQPAYGSADRIPVHVLRSSPRASVTRVSHSEPSPPTEPPATTAMTKFRSTARSAWRNMLSSHGQRTAPSGKGGKTGTWWSRKVSAFGRSSRCDDGNTARTGTCLSKVRSTFRKMCSVFDGSTARSGRSGTACTWARRSGETATGVYAESVYPKYKPPTLDLGPSLTDGASLFEPDWTNHFG